jgi:hypothetical protein
LDKLSTRPFALSMLNILLVCARRPTRCATDYIIQG